MRIRLSWSKIMILQVNLLSLLSAASLEQRGQELWLQEILAVLELCVSHCHDVAKHLTDQLWHFCQLLCTCDEPLCLSLGKVLPALACLLYVWCTASQHCFYENKQHQNDASNPMRRSKIFEQPCSFSYMLLCHMQRGEGWVQISKQSFHQMRADGLSF